MKGILCDPEKLDEDFFAQMNQYTGILVKLQSAVTFIFIQYSILCPSRVKIFLKHTLDIRGSLVCFPHIFKMWTCCQRLLQDPLYIQPITGKHPLCASVGDNSDNI